MAQNKNDDLFGGSNFAQSEGVGSDLFSGLVSSGQKEQGPQRATPESAKKPYGDLEITKHLYKTGLQNIFNDYQKNIATLNQKEQKSLQDAYTVKRLSQKYLGEYASNTGAGDVSGQLLDIYGNYQRNLSDIQQNFGELQVGLEQEYQQQRQQMMSELMMTEHNIEMEKLNEQANQVLFNAMRGETDGLTPFEYLEEHREELGERNFRAAYDSLYQQTLEEVSTNIQQGFFGYTENEAGERVRETDPEKYLKQFKGVLNESHYNMLSGALPNPATLDHAFNIMRGDYGEFDNGFEYLENIRENLSQEEYVQYYSAIRDNVINEMQTKAETQFYGYREEGGERVPRTSQEYLEELDEKYGDVLGGELEYNYLRDILEHNKNIEEEMGDVPKSKDITSPQTVDEEGNTIDNPHYVEGLDLDGLSMFSGDDFGSNSQAYEIEGARYVKIDSNIENDEFGQENFGDDYPVSSQAVTDAYLEASGGVPPRHGETFFHPSGFTFMREGNTWHRMREITSATMEPSDVEMANWNSNNSDTGKVRINTRKARNDQIFVGEGDNEREYRAESSSRDWEDLDSALREKFERIHNVGEERGDMSRNQAMVVYHEGDFWLAKTGYTNNVMFYKMNRHDD